MSQAIVPVKVSRRRLERIARILDMRHEGLEYPEIAKFFGISLRQVHYDRKIGERLARATFEGFDVGAVLGKLYKRLAYDIDRYTRLAAEADNEPARIAYHKLAQTATMNLLKFLCDSGLIKAEAQGGDEAIPQAAFESPTVRDLYLKIMIAVREEVKSA